MANKLLNLKVGSNGNDVKNLQVALKDAGYDVGKAGADGIYGKDTEAAVKQYQKDNGLAVDGIAGKNTLGSLNEKKQAVLKGDDGEVVTATGVKNLAKKSNNTTGQTGTTGKTGTTGQTGTATTTDTKGKDEGKKDSAEEQKQTEVSKTETPSFSFQEFQPGEDYQYKNFDYGESFNYGDNYQYQNFDYGDKFSYEDFSYDDFTYADYTESDTVKQANALLQQHINSKPGEYQNTWENKLNDYMNQIENRDPFSYDFNSDALYNQYKDLYTQQGQMAMMDTMGQAAAMTGGYGNSYAQSVGQQAYNQQLSQLNSVMPELYQMAYDRYTQEGQDLYNKYNMIMDRENQDYGRYQDNLSNWYQDRDYYTSLYDTERNFDYGTWESDRNFKYGVYSDDRNLKYDNYSTNKNLAYDDYALEKNLGFEENSMKNTFGFDEHTKQKDYAFDEFSAQKDYAFQENSMQNTFGFDEHTKQKDYAYDEFSKRKDYAFEDNQMANNYGYDTFARREGYDFEENSMKNTFGFEDYQNALNMAYQKERDAVSDAQWQAEFDERYKSSGSGSGTVSGKDTGTVGTTYKTMSTSDMWDLNDRFKKMTPDDALAWADRIAAQNGYDPEAVRDIARQATAGQEPEQTDDTGLTESRQIEIENWVANACANANGPSFDPNKLIKGSGYFANEAERDYAYAVVKAMSGTR